MSNFDKKMLMIICVTCIVVLATLLVSQTIGFSLLKDKPQAKTTHTFLKQLTYVLPRESRVGADLCPLCIQLDDQVLNILLNEVLQIGVVGGCGAICGALADKTGSQALGAICNILCDIAGVDEFAKIVEKADLDPILFCEDLKQCPINDNGDAKIEVFTVKPKKGPQGEFKVELGYTSKNGTGTGETVLEVETVDGIPVASSFLTEALEAGSYNKTFNLKAEPNPDCDPTQGPCEQWLPGEYTVKIAVCNGECGSKHPHSQIYDESTATFTITEN